MKNGNEKFETAWLQVVELIEDEGFGDDVCGPDYTTQCKQLDELIASWELPSVAPTIRDEFHDMVSSAAREYYFAEYAGEAPGSRSSHMSMHKRYKTVVKNRVRVLFDIHQKGLNEAKEIDTFLREHAKAGVFSQYDAEGASIRKAIIECFGLKSIAQDLVGVAVDRYGAGEKRKNEASGWNPTLMEYAGILLAHKRHKNG